MRNHPRPDNRHRPCAPQNLVEGLEARSMFAVDPIVVDVNTWGPQPLQNVPAEFYLSITGQLVPFGQTGFAAQARNLRQAQDAINRNALEATRATFGLSALGAAVISAGILQTSRVVTPLQPPEPGQNTSPSFPPMATGQPVAQGTGDTVLAVSESLRYLSRLALALSLTASLDYYQKDKKDGKDYDEIEVITRVVPLANGTVGQITISIPDNLIIVVASPWAGQAGASALDQMSDFWLNEFDVPA